MTHAALALTALALGGCGYVPFFFLDGGGSDSSDTAVAASAPVASIATIGRQPDDVIEIPFTVRDAQSDPVEALVEYSTTGGVTFTPATPLEGANPLLGLASSPDGVAHTFVWDAAADLPGATPDVRIRVTPRDASGVGLPVTSAPFGARNAPPVLSVSAAGLPAEVRGLVQIGFHVADATGDPTTLEVDVLHADGSSVEATLAGWETQGVAGPFAAPPGGATHSFVWSTLTDLGASEGAVQLVVTPRDGHGGIGAPVSIGPFDNVNDDRPSAAAGAVERTPGPVTIPLTLFLLEEGAVDLRLRYEVGGGDVPVDDAHLERLVEGEPVAGASARQGLAAAPEGVAHALRWDAPADLGDPSAQEVLLRVEPFFVDGGGAEVTGDAIEVALISGNDAPEVLAVSPSPTPGSGLVPFTVTVADSSADPVALTVERSTDGGASWEQASVAVGALTDVATAPAPEGRAYALAWDAAADLGDGSHAGLLLRVAVTDFPGTAHAASGDLVSDPFDVTTGDAPVAVITAPTAGQIVRAHDGPVGVGLTLFERTGAPADVALELRLPGGAFAPATLLDPDAALGLAAAPGGTAHTLQWDAAADVRDDLEGVELRAVASNAAGALAGSPVTDLRIDGNRNPALVVATPPSPVTDGLVPLAITVLDAEGDPVDIIPRVSFDGGASFMPATFTEPLTGLASSPVGVVHAGAADGVVWDALADLQAAGLSELYAPATVIELTPLDNPLLPDLSTGTAVQAGPFVVDLRPPDSMSPVDPALSAVWSDVTPPDALPADGEAIATITVLLRDAADQPLPGRPVSIEPSSPYALVSPGAAVTDAAGQATAALRSVRSGTVIVRAVADPGASEVVLAQEASVLFSVAPPQVVDLRLPADPVRARGVIEYAVRHEEAAPADVRVEVGVPDGAGGVAWTRATQASSAPGESGVRGVRTSRASGGALHRFHWASDRDLQGADLDDVRIRIEASAAGATGAPREATGLRVRNGLAFAPGQSVALPFMPAAFIARDLTRNGRLDLLLPDPGADRLVIVPARFDDLGVAQSIEGPLGQGGLVHAAVGDLAGDGRFDVVAANTAGALSIFRGYGGEQLRFETWSEEVRSDGVVSPVRAVALGDLSRSGRTDIVAAHDHGISILLQGEGGGWPELPFDLVEETLVTDAPSVPGALALADLDRDGWLDIVLVAAGKVVIVFGADPGDTGGAPFGAVEVVEVAGLAGVPVVTDLDGDGRLDVAVPGPGSAVTLLRNAGDRDFVVETITLDAVPDAPSSIAVADLDGSGRLDIAAALPSHGGLHILLQDAAGAFAPATLQPDPAGGEPLLLAAGDQDGDGRVDLLAVHDAATPFVAVLANARPARSDPRLLAPRAYSMRGAPYAVVPADLNRDGKPDVVVGTTDGVRVLLGRGDGSLAPGADLSWLFEPMGFYRAVATGDFTGDGHVDVAVAGGAGMPDPPVPPGGTSTPGTLTLLAGDGAGGLQATGLALEVPHPLAMAAADIDGDGHVDVAVASMEGVHLFFGDGAGGLPDRVDLTGPEGRTFMHTAVELGDLTGNGQLDLIFTGLVEVEGGEGEEDTVEGRLLVARQVEPRSFAVEEAATLADLSVSVALADLDEDGHLDVVAAVLVGDYTDAAAGDAGLVVLRGDGTGGFVDRHDLLVVEQPDDTDHVRARSAVAVAVADVEGSGLLDLLALTLGERRMRIVFQEEPEGGATLAFDEQGEGVEVGGEVLALVIAELDGSGRPNAVLAKGTHGGGGEMWGAVSVIVGPEDALGGERRLETRDRPIGVAAVDLTGDGRPEIALTHVDAGLEVWVQDGPDAFDEAGAHRFMHAAEHLVGLPIQLTAADLTGDGGLELLVPYWTGGEAFRFSSDGNEAALASIGSIDTGATEQRAAVAVDAARDGWTDLVVAGFDSAGNGNGVFLLRDPLGGQSQPEPQPQLAGWMVDQLLAADLDGSGRAEIIAAEGGLDGSRVGLLLGGFHGWRWQELPLASGAQPVGIAAGRIERSGFQGMAVSHQSPHGVALLVHGAASGELSGYARLDIPLEVAPGAVAFADVTGDGRDELLVLLPDSGSVAVFSGFDGLAYTRRQDYMVGRWPVGLSVADLDRDGVPDIVVLTEDPAGARLIRGR